jgi:hypothetical protein
LAVKPGDVTQTRAARTRRRDAHARAASFRSAWLAHTRCPTKRDLFGPNYLVFVPCTKFEFDRKSGMVARQRKTGRKERQNQNKRERESGA